MASVRVPALLDRLEVARPTPGATVVVEDFKRWSAPLGDLAMAALTEDLSDRLNGVAVYPARAIAPLGARDVSVDLAAFSQDGETLELSGSATVTDARTGALLVSLPLRLRARAPADAQGEALALSQMMGEVADLLTQSLRATTTSASR